MSRVIVQEGIDLQVLNVASSTLNGQPDEAKSIAEPLAPGRVLGGRPGSANDGMPRHTAGPLLESVESSNTLSSTRTSMVILQLTAVSFLGSFAHGIVVVGLPVIASALNLSRELYLWPVSVYGLTSGSVLLIAGSVADLIGPRRVELAGVLLLAAFTLSCGFAATGLQLVILRALAGIAIAMHMTASVAIVAQILPNGRARNVGFACLGLSQPLGFSFGLVMSGVMIGGLGWRAGFYIAGGVMLIVAVMAFWVLPRLHRVRHERRGLAFALKRIATEVDWIGCLLASAGLALLAYVLAMVGAELASIRSAKTATLLAIGLTSLSAFPFWEHRQTQGGRPALIPNSMWSKLPFTTTCLMILLSWGAMNGMELFSTLYFEEVQEKSALVASLYLLPSLLVGVCLNLTTGFLVDRLPVRWLVTLSTLLCAPAPLMMALVNPDWSYWLVEFWAQLCAPLSGDVLFTVGLIIVSETFPPETQALAGAVFNTVGQLGQSLGIGLCQAVALGVAGRSDADGGGEGAIAMLLKGYRASFWTMFAYMMLCGLLAPIGLRNVGKVGLKRE